MNDVSFTDKGGEEDSCWPSANKQAGCLFLDVFQFKSIFVFSFFLLPQDMGHIQAPNASYINIGQRIET